MDDLVDHALTTFPILPELAAPTDALSICGASGLAVIVDGAQLPIGLVTPRDLERAVDQGASSLADAAAPAPPCVVGREDVDLDELFSYNVLPAFAVGARGVVFVSGQGTAMGVMLLDELLRLLTERESSNPEAGVLFRRFTDYLFSRDPALDLDLLDGVVPLYRGPRKTEILVRCRDCGYLNRLDFLNPQALPRCQDPDRPPHTLTLP